MIANLHRLDTVPTHKLEWLWFPFLARGAVTVVEGAPGVGKSLFVADLVARLSRGAALPDGQTAPRVRSLFMTPEESLSRSLKPKLEGAGVDLTNVYAFGSLGEESLVLQDELDKVRAILREGSIEVLVIDSLESFAPELMRPRHVDRLRKLMASLADLAARENVAIVVVTQTEVKKRSGISFLNSVSIALRVEEGEAENERVVRMTRSTVGPTRSAGSFRLPDQESPKLLWPDGKQAAPPRKLEIVPLSDVGVLDEVVTWLAALLALGPAWVVDIHTEGEAQGYRPRTIERASFRLDVRSEYVVVNGVRRYYWVTPTLAHLKPALDRWLQELETPVASPAKPVITNKMS